MKLFNLVLILLSLLSWRALAGQETRLEGEWKLVGMIYRGEEVPPLNPQLNLRWTFFANGTERLYWDRQGENGFCERFATYKILDGQIHETVFAVNPLNSLECSQDPDMQVGRHTVNTIEVKQQQILLHLQLGDEELIYILKEVLSGFDIRRAKVKNI